VNFEELSEWIRLIGEGRRLPPAISKRIGGELPTFIANLTAATAPKRLTLPTGETLRNATRMTALKCQCLLLARHTGGINYTKAEPAYDRLAKDTLFWVMRHHFQTGDPQGTFCCPPCTLSLLPLYALDAFRWVRCSELKSNVLAALDARESVFESAYPKAYADWALNLSKPRRKDTHP